MLTRVPPSVSLAAPGFSIFVQNAPGRYCYHSSIDEFCCDEAGLYSLQLHVPPSTAPKVQLLAADGNCECAYDVRPTGPGRLSAPAPRTHGPSSGGQRHFHMSERRQLLRILAPESAMPGLSWALGLDALRVLEAHSADGGLDWLVSIDADEEDDMRERIICGVQGESFRRDRAASALHIEALEAGPHSALVLPEACRVAAVTPGALPADADIWWRISAGSGQQPSPLARCIDGQTRRPYWLGPCSSAADARLLARSLPPRCTWLADVSSSKRLPDAAEVTMLREAGCGGLAVRKAPAATGSE